MDVPDDELPSYDQSNLDVGVLCEFGVLELLGSF